MKKMSLLAILSLTAIGVYAMSLFNDELHLNWEYPVGQQVANKIAIQISSVAPDDGGFLGLRNNPSSKYGFPNPIIMKGKIISTNLEKWAGKKMQLRLPQTDSLNFHSGDKIAIAIVATDSDDGYNGMCIEKLPENLTDSDLAAWLKKWECKKPA